MTKRERKYHSNDNKKYQKWRKRLAKNNINYVTYSRPAFDPININDITASGMMIPDSPLPSNMFLSDEAIDKLTFAPRNESINILGIEIKRSSLFPFKMDDGSMCHGVVMPVDPPPEAYDSPRLNFFNDEPNFPWTPKPNNI